MLLKFKARSSTNRNKFLLLVPRNTFSKRPVSSSNNLKNDTVAHPESDNSIITNPTTNTSIKEGHNLAAKQTAKSARGENKQFKNYINFPASWNKNQKSNKQILYWKNIPANEIGMKEYGYNISPRIYLGNEPSFFTKDQKENQKKKQAIMLSNNKTSSGSILKDTWNGYLTKEHGSPLNYELGEKGRFIMATLGTLYTLAKQKPQYFDIPFLGGNVKHPHDILNRANLRLLRGDKGISLNALNMDSEWRHLPKSWVDDANKTFFSTPKEHIIEQEQLSSQPTIDPEMLLNDRSSNAGDNILNVFSNGISDILKHHNMEMKKKKNIKGRKRNRLNKKRN